MPSHPVFLGLIYPVFGLMFAGSAPLMVGLALILPFLGHASWHLYRRAVVAVRPPAGI